MTNPNSSAHDIAVELQQALFRLYDQDNQPDVEWTEDGPQWGTTFHDAEDGNFEPKIEAGEQQLDDYLREHRNELGSHPHWRSRYSALDATEVAPEQTSGTDRTAPISASGDYRYVVNMSGPFGGGGYGIAVPGRTLEDAYAYSLEQLGQQEVWSALTPVTIEVSFDQNIIPPLGFTDSFERVIERLSGHLSERAAATALVLARSALRPWQAAHPAAIGSDSRLAHWIQMTKPHFGMETGDLEIDDLVAQWAVTEIAVNTSMKTMINEWDGPMRYAGFYPRLLRTIATRDSVALATAPRHPYALQQFRAMQSLIAERSNELTAATAMPRSELGPPEAAQIRQLIDVAESDSGTAARPDSSAPRTPELPVPEANSAPEIEL